MEAVDNGIIEKISILAEQLPQVHRKQLLDLMATWQTDIRYAPREPYPEKIRFSVGGGNHFGHARDVSATGLFIEAAGDFELGDKVRMILTFISAPNPLRLSGTVVRKEKGGIGVRFDQRSQSQVKELGSIIAKQALIFHRK
ncbi:PilZ domain-containing protein [Mariprofundus aestuarium]|uniref:PilZ domain-containing protein n=1 Tax=Mariprofundus aestuarium TaxID=1921086 RepID=A0A2K8KW70_MARES|nr:PilZ domain-containing protein [Mariprofundus aestuarium]ATX79043.1 PilZ domain-containing protein [Mariprofundus aestuarium]